MANMRQSKLLTDTAYERIKRRIITCALEPGRQITAEQLTTSYMVRRRALDDPANSRREIVCYRCDESEPRPWLQSINISIELPRIDLLDDPYCLTEFRRRC